VTDAGGAYGPHEFDGIPRIEGAAGVPDAYQRLWVPHRIAYIHSNHDGEKEPDGGCPFCAAPGLSDEDALIVHRGEHAFVLLNLFPYNSGHLLVCPYRHVALLDEATDEETREITALTQTAMRVLRADSNCDGFNIGLNQGRVAGAGVADHLHQHVVPRWASDANFFPIVAQTKALPVLLGDTREALARAWPA
jgi:ATP adenylyltransferase